MKIFFALLGFGLVSGGLYALRPPAEMPPVYRAMAVLDLSAPWCSGCREYAPTFESLAAKWGRPKSDITFKTINIDDDRGALARYGVQMIPTVVVLDEKGAVVARFVGGATEEQLLKAFGGKPARKP